MNLCNDWFVHVYFIISCIGNKTSDTITSKSRPVSRYLDTNISIALRLVHNVSHSCVAWHGTTQHICCAWFLATFPFCVSVHNIPWTWLCRSTLPLNYPTWHYWWRRLTCYNDEVTLVWSEIWLVRAHLLRCHATEIELDSIQVARCDEA